jgi:hypothetical protein
MATKHEAEMEELRKENKKLSRENNRLKASESTKDEQLREKDLHIKFLTDRLSQWADRFFELRTTFINLPISEKVNMQERMQNGKT